MGKYDDCDMSRSSYEEWRQQQLTNISNFEREFPADPVIEPGASIQIKGVQMKGTTVEQVKKFREEMYLKSTALIDKKGNDYCGEKQDQGDTLFNLRVCELLGITETTEQGVMVRLSDKLMRLATLTKPGRESMVKDESVLDTIADIHNYTDYLGLIHLQRKGVL